MVFGGLRDQILMVFGGLRDQIFIVFRGLRKSDSRCRKSTFFDIQKKRKKTVIGFCREPPKILSLRTTQNFVIFLSRTTQKIVIGFCRDFFHGFLPRRPKILLLDFVATHQRIVIDFWREPRHGILSRRPKNWSLDVVATPQKNVSGFARHPQNVVIGFGREPLQILSLTWVAHLQIRHWFWSRRPEKSNNWPRARRGVWELQRCSEVQFRIATGAVACARRRRADVVARFCHRLPAHGNRHGEGLSGGGFGASGSGRDKNSHEHPIGFFLFVMSTLSSSPMKPGSRIPAHWFTLCPHRAHTKLTSRASARPSSRRRNNKRHCKTIEKAFERLLTRSSKTLWNPSRIIGNHWMVMETIHKIEHIGKPPKGLLGSCEAFQTQ